MNLDDELLPRLRDGFDTSPRKKKQKKDAATGAYAAGMRALSARMLTFFDFGFFGVLTGVSTGQARRGRTYLLRSATWPLET